MGVVSLPSDCFTRFGNPAWPGIRTTYFAAFGSWQGVHPKDTESLRDSDALMRVAVPRRRGPAGLRDLFCFCQNFDLYILRSELFACARRGVVLLLPVYSACSQNAGRPLVKTAHLPFLRLADIIGFSNAKFAPFFLEQQQFTANSPGSLRKEPELFFCVTSWSVPGTRRSALSCRRRWGRNDRRPRRW